METVNDYNVAGRAEDLDISRNSFYRYAEKGMPHPADQWIQEAWLAKNVKSWAKKHTGRGTTSTPPPSSSPLTQPDLPAQPDPEDPDRPWVIPTPKTWAEEKQRQDAIYRKQQTTEGREAIIEEERHAITAEAKGLLAHLQVTIRKHLCDGCTTRIEAAVREALAKVVEEGTKAQRHEGTEEEESFAASDAPELDDEDSDE